MTAPARPLSLFWTTLGLPVLLGLFGWTAAPAWGDDLSRALGKDFNAGNFTQVEEMIQRELDRDPDQPRLWLELGALRQDEGDNAGALAAYQACGVDPFPLRLDEAKTLLRLAKLDDAEALYQRLNAEKPDDARILWGLAQVDGDRARWGRFRTFAERQAAWARSQAWLLKTVQAAPDFALGFWQLAEASRELGDVDTALTAYNKTLALDGSFKEAHRRVAEMLARKHDYRGALAQYEQAMAIDPNDQALKQEARRVEQRVPRTVERRRTERLAQWEGFQPPEGSPLPDSPVTLRVGVGRELGRLLFKCAADLQVTTPAGVPVTLLPGGAQYCARYYPARRSPPRAELWRVESADSRRVFAVFRDPLWFTPVQPGKPIALHALMSNAGYFFAREQDKAYRGILELQPRPGLGFQAVNRVSLEQYLGGVIPSEMPASWPDRALQVQAILARTYALSKLGRHQAEGFDVCDSVHCQVYGGVGAENPRANDAIRATAGEVLERDGKIMPVAFSAECGGHTQDYQEAWGTPNTGVVGVRDDAPGENPDMDFPLSPYLLETWIHEDRPAYCHIPGLKGYQNFRWVTVVRAADLEAKAPQVGRIRRLVVERRSSAGWADRLLVEGERGREVLNGDLLRGFLGGIRSNLIWVETQSNPEGWPDAFLIYGGGWGHGVGLCQVGTLGMVRAGKGVEEILRHYFPLGELRKLPEHPDAGKEIP